MKEPNMSLGELAARVEALQGPCRETDVLIKQAIFAPRGIVRQSPFNGNWCIYEVTAGGKERLVERPFNITHSAWKNDAYTASIDAAMQLVPEGWTYWDIAMKRLGTGNDGARAEISRLMGGQEEAERSFARTPALALCAAALKARSLSALGGRSQGGEE